MAENVPIIELNNGLTVPALGLGTWMSKPEDVTQAVKDAIDLGYRHIDCAFIYCNENAVGEAIREKIEEGVVTREELFVVSKLWNTYHNPELVETALQKSLENFGLEYLDLFLIHFPMGLQEGDELYPTDENGKWIPSDFDYVDTYNAMENMIEKGMTKSIGVSNFNKGQIERILENCTIPPAINQIECHPFMNQEKLIEFCKSHNIAVTGYSPFASPESPFRQPSDPVILEDPLLKELADKYDKSIAQITLRWIIQRGLIVIPKSVTQSRIAQNMDIFDFELAEEDVATINNLNLNFRSVGMQSADNHQYFPFNDEY